ncbi:MAG: 4a-hydroxytetrahydrobiopterin dehydratase, partial [Mycobacterium sp.]|nr:4a-hydroxytetrahydrobiopterin dehydratase [Mycobacterium sp.]
MHDDERLTRQQVSDAVSPLGWRLVLGAVYTEVDVPSLARAAEVAAIAAAGVGADGQDHLTVDVR